MASSILKRGGGFIDAWGISSQNIEVLKHRYSKVLRRFSLFLDKRGQL